MNVEIKTILQDLRDDADVIGEYLQHVDEHHNECKGSASRYLQKDGTYFLIVDSYGNFIKEFNEWARKSQYYERLVGETRHDCNGDEDWWIGYLTEEKWGYDDEYIPCFHCENVVHYCPTSGEADNYWINDGDFMCEDCIRENSDDYVSEYLSINYEKGVPAGRIPINNVFSSRELEEKGFECVRENLEVGMYGIYDDPKKILKELIGAYRNTDFICHCISNNPFATRYEIYAKGSEETLYTDRVYGGKFTYDEMVNDAKENYDYGDETNFLTCMSNWWKEHYREL